MGNEATVLYSVHDGVATLTLNRPEVYHALNAQMHADLMAGLARAEDDPSVRAVILTGTDQAFCSGQDLREFPTEGTVEMIGERLRDSYNPLVRKLQTLPKPILAAINGVAAGAGLSLALACDLRLAGQQARLVVAFARIGLIPDCGMLYTLPHLIGHARAFELAALGGELDATTAMAWGMVNRVVPDDEVPTAAQALAAQLAHGPATAIRLIKAGLAESRHASLDAMLDYELHAQQIAGAHPDFREGVAAFVQKRAARFH
ncbi:enoyl-CoA hydratase-related protein [Candidatus Chloroploca asiatica]|uniref:2-(1,2-epoxy-1,2-dihydrophenyl)acetyl-CoA isomerase n=1 Tax=Candidatus Chloroploca asiatica TaxID=1506545 RepID=A0A2H3KII6_9CHLR|nr:enoyl-CoA hydratase-related protein [Candidatus Chloroploca asiatica]PDV97680.1 hypothetical protein A9Q02_04300 [Candidatus Chloroploca asiatica]